MSSTRRARIERLLAVRTRALDVARAALGSACRERVKATVARDLAERAWEERAQLLMTVSSLTMDALALAHAHLGGLRRRADHEAATLLDAQRREGVALQACMEANREVKKMEIWKDRLAELERAEENRRERIITDEVAARTFARAGA